MPVLPAIPAESDVRISRLIAHGTRQIDAARARTRHVAVAVAASAAVAVATSGFALVGYANHQMQARTAYCYEGAVSSTAGVQVGIPDLGTSGDGSESRRPDPGDRVASALDLCASVWRAGLFSRSASGTAVPPLVPCRRTDGVISVFAVEDPADAADAAAVCRANDMAAAR